MMVLLWVRIEEKVLIFNICYIYIYIEYFKIGEKVMIVTHIEKGSQITMKDGSYKSIEDVVVGDEVQTYSMAGEEFDSANMSHNEQTSTSVTNCGKSTEEMPLVKINFESVSFDDDEEVKSESSLVMNSTGVMMGGDNIGWVIPDFDGVTKILIDEHRRYVDEVKDWGNQLEIGMDVSADSDKSLMNKKVVSIEEVSGIETYYIDALKDGDSIFVNDVLVFVDR